MHNNHRFSKLNGKNGEKYTTNREMDRAREETEKKCEMSIEYERMTNNLIRTCHTKKQNGKRSQNEILKQKHAIYFTLT